MFDSKLSRIRGTNMEGLFQFWNWLTALLGKRTQETTVGDDYVYLEGDEQPPATGPWFRLVGTTMQDGQLKMEFDWSPDFIKLLANNGYNGADPEDVIMRWLNKVTNTEQ